MSKTKVILSQCSDYSPAKLEEAIEKHLSLMGGLNRLVSRGDRVLLKPNFIAPKSRRRAVQTDPEVILQMARMLKDSGARPFVGDSPAWGDTFACIKALRLEESLKHLGVPVKQLDRPKWLKIRTNNLKIGISSAALEADKIINLPKFKSHQQLVATFAVKNMFGCVSGKQKAFWHFLNGGQEELFCELLIEVYKILSPAFTLIDGIVAMDGRGPIQGRARPLGLLIGGLEPISCELVCARLAGFEPDDIPIIKTARKIGFGCAELSDIEILGERLDDCLCSDFVPAQRIPIRFSLLHVCKSVCKQMALLAGSVFGSRHDR
jgi:uncharacterized protein (DUF362 family)